MGKPGCAHPRAMGGDVHRAGTSRREDGARIDGKRIPGKPGKTAQKTNYQNITIFARINQILL